jgi:hypothetical protein
LRTAYSTHNKEHTVRKLLTLCIALAAIVAVPVSSFGGSMTLLGVGKAASGGGGSPPTTWNPSDIGPNLSLSGGNLTVTQSTAIFDGVRSIASHSTGKYYWENTLNFSVNGTTGFANATASLNGSFIGGDNNGVGYQPAGNIWMGGSTTPVQTAAVGDVVGYALDMGNLKFWVRTIHLGVAGNWNNSGTDNPATNTGGFNYTGLAAGPYFAAASLNGNGENVVTNFGATAFAASAPAGFVNW